jgi:hypothetical protein
MKNLRDILSGTESLECSDTDLEETITEAVASEETPNSEVEVEKPASADKVTLAMANLSDMVTMADEIYYTLSEMEEIEEDMVNDIKSAFVSLDEIYKEVDEKYDIATPEMGPDTVEEAEELLGQDIDDILNEEAKTIQMKNLEDLKGKKEILTAMYGAMRKMRKADLQASYKYMKSSHCSSHDATEMMGKRDDILLGMMKTLKAMKMADLKDSYGYMKASYGYDESMEMDQEDEMITAGHCSEETELDEAIDFSKVPDKNLISWVTKFRTVKGKPWHDFKQDMAAAEREVKLRKLKVEAVELEEMKEPFAIIDTADGNKVVATASHEDNAKRIISTSQLPPMKIKDKRTLKIVKAKKKQMIGRPIEEEAELHEMKTKDDDLAVFVYDFIGADTEGKPLKTLIKQAVGKYFGSQKNKGEETEER